MLTSHRRITISTGTTERNRMRARFHLRPRGSMALSLLLVAVLACRAGEPGPAGPEGPPGEAGAQGPRWMPSFGLVIPSSLVLDRSDRVRIHLELLEVDAHSTVDFGEGIDVLEVRPVGPTTLEAHVVVDVNAEVGLRDVRVTARGETVVGRGAFRVRPALEVHVMAETVRQGGYYGVTVANLDRTRFDPAHFELSSPGLLFLYPGQLTGTAAYYGALVPPRAALGPAHVEARNALDGQVVETYRSASGVVTIEEGPTRTVSGSAGPIELVEEGATESFRFDLEPMTGFVELTLHAAADAPTAPFAWLFGDTGDADTYLSHAGSAPQPEGGRLGRSYLPVDNSNPFSVYAVVADNYLRGGSGFTFGISVSSLPTPLVHERPSSHAQAPGQSLAGCLNGATLQPCLVRGQVSSENEVDVYFIPHLASATQLAVFLSASDPLEAWAQDGQSQEVDVELSEVGDFDINRTITIGPNKLAMSGTWGGRESWTLVVRGVRRATGDYLLGLAPL